ALLSRPVAQGQSPVSGDQPAASGGYGLHAPVLRPGRHGEPAEGTAARSGDGPDELLALHGQSAPPAVLRRGLRLVPNAADRRPRHRARHGAGLDAARAAGEDRRLGRTLGAAPGAALAAGLPMARRLVRRGRGAARHLTRRSPPSWHAPGRSLSPPPVNTARAHAPRPSARRPLIVTPPRAIASTRPRPTQRPLEPSRPLVSAFTNSPG